MQMLNLYFKIPEVIRFIIIYFLNAVISYFIFMMFYVTLFVRNYETTATVLIFIISTVIAFVTMKLLVFNTSQQWLSEGIKTFICYILTAILNVLIIYLFIDIFGVEAIVAQIIAILVVATVTYFGLKHFSFNHDILSI